MFYDGFDLRAPALQQALQNYQEEKFLDRLRDKRRGEEDTLSVLTFQQTDEAPMGTVIHLPMATEDLRKAA